MNANKNTFNVKLERFQIQETLSSLIHTIIWLRSKRNVDYIDNGCAWFTNVDCETIDLTYIRTNCEQLEKHIRDEISRFAQFMISSPDLVTGYFTLEFYKKEIGTWGIPVESAAWEVWTVNFEIVNYKNNEDKRNKLREDIGALLSQNIVIINNIVNNAEYVPEPQKELSLIYDLTFENVQQYYFRFTSSQPESYIQTLKSFCYDITRMFYN